MFKFLSVALLTTFTVPAFAQKANQCNLVTKKYDNQTISTTPVSEKVSFGKVITATDTTYYLTLNAYGRTLLSDVYGVKVLLDGGRMIQYEGAAVKATGKKTPNGAYIYESIIKLQKVEMVYLFLYKIAGYELYILSGSITDPEATRLKKYAECIF